MSEPAVSSYYDAKLCTPELKLVGDELRAQLKEAIGAITAVAGHTEYARLGTVSNSRPAEEVQS